MRHDDRAGGTKWVLGQTAPHYAILSTTIHRRRENAIFKTPNDPLQLLPGFAGIFSVVQVTRTLSCARLWERLRAECIAACQAQSSAPVVCAGDDCSRQCFGDLRNDGLPPGQACPAGGLGCDTGLYRAINRRCSGLLAAGILICPFPLSKPVLTPIMA